MNQPYYQPPSISSFNKNQYAYQQIPYESYKGTALLAFWLNFIPFIGGFVAVVFAVIFFYKRSQPNVVSEGTGWAVAGTIIALFSMIVLTAGLVSPNSSSNVSPASTQPSNNSSDYEIGACWSDSINDTRYVTPTTCNDADYVVSGRNAVQDLACQTSDTNYYYTTVYYANYYYCLTPVK